MVSREIRNVPVAVVGGAGFLGSHLVDHLVLDRGCDVLVIDNLCVGQRDWIHHKATFEHADISVSESRLKDLFRSVEFVFNWAAHPYIPISFDRPAHVCATNFNGAMNVINAAHEAGVTGILQVSSAEIYGGGQWGDESINVVNGGKLKETSAVAPHSSYGASKAAIDFYVQARWREAKVPCIALRQFNCVGERESHPYVVPEIIGQLFRNKQDNGHLPVYLGNNSVRDFLYAGDAVRYAVELLERGEFGAVYNLGSETGVQIYTLAQMLADVVGAGRVTVYKDPARVRPWEIWHLCSDNTKINSVCTYRPQTPLKAALAKAVEWFKENGQRWPWEEK